MYAFKTARYAFKTVMCLSVHLPKGLCGTLRLVTGIYVGEDLSAGLHSEGIRVDRCGVVRVVVRHDLLQLEQLVTVFVETSGIEVCVCVGGGHEFYAELWK